MLATRRRGIYLYNVFHRVILYTQYIDLRNPQTRSKSHAPQTPFPKMKKDLDIAKSNVEPKYCQTCGRLISANHRNFAERKYCSKSCGASKPNVLDRDLETLFVKLAKERGSVECSEVQKLHGNPDAKLPVDEDALPSQKHRAGMDEAQWRERVRRAARRVVVFPHEQERFECVQKGKAVEPSFAKGEWSVRYVKE